MPAPLPTEQRQHLRRVLVEEVLPRFNGDQSAAAEKLGVDQSTINRLVLHQQGGSFALAQAIAKFLNDSPSRILGLGLDEQAIPKLREIAGFEAAMDAARRQVADEYLGRLEPWHLEHAADHKMVPPPERILPGLLIQVALACSKPESQRRKR